MTERFLGKLFEIDEVHSGIKAHDHRSFNVALADAFRIIRILGSVTGRVIIPHAAVVMDRRLPLDVGGRIELTDLVGSPGKGAVTANRPIHYVTGNALSAESEGDII